jgi:four helix bundle protein
MRPMRNDNLKERTKRFALDVIHFVEHLPNTETCRVIGRQLLRAGTSVGANYRAAARARSTADFISKMTVVEEEADECAYWTELLLDDGKVGATQASPLLQEASELTAIAVSSANTARGARRKSAERGMGSAERL